MPTSEERDGLLDAAVLDLSQGRFERAATALDEVAEGLTDPVSHSRALRLAALAHRLSGNAEAGIDRALAATSAAPPSSEVQAEALLEYVLGLLDAGRNAEAAEAAAEARTWATEVTPGLRARVLATSAYAAAASGDALGAAEAIDELTAAMSGQALERGLASIPPDTAGRWLDALMQDVSRDATRSTSRFLEAAEAIRRGDVSDARAAAQAAREAARQDADVPAYVGAALLQAQLAEAAGDRAAAYESVAVGWASVREATSDDVARAAFEDKMNDFIDRWGADAYTQIRDAYAQAQAARSES